MIPRRRVERRRGEIRLRFSREERELLRQLAGELRARLGREADAPDLRRLFPPAYEQSPEDDAEYRRLTGDALRTGRLDELRVFEATLDGERLSEQELEVWLAVLNGLRLVLGTRLDVTEETFDAPVDPGSPDAHDLAVYGYLSWLEEHCVEAASAALDR